MVRDTGGGASTRIRVNDFPLPWRKIDDAEAEQAAEQPADVRKLVELADPSDPLDAAEPGRLAHQLLGGRGAVEEAEVAVAVELGVARHQS